jgi:hypothetical protein
LFVQRDTEGVVLKWCLLIKLMLFSSWTNYILFPFSSLPFIELYQMLTIGLMYVCIHTLVCLFNLISFFTSSQWAYWWLIDKHGLCRRNGQLNREYTFEQHNRTLMAWHWQHKGLVVSIEWEGGGEGKKRGGVVFLIVLLLFFRIG